MRSKYADFFNHDSDAPDYDQDVQREGNPIRAGYSALLAWIGGQVPQTASVLDLGSGTGNTIRALPASCRVTAVDVSQQMTEIARTKLADRPVEFVIEDIMTYLEGNDLEGFDCVVSTYALHHLTPEERSWLLSSLCSRNRPGTHVLIGDLMYRDDGDRARILEAYSPTYPDLGEVFEEEFLWDIAQSQRELDRLGKPAEWHRFSDLSWALSFFV